MNRELIVARTRIVHAIRRFFDERGFTEMLTPRLVSLPGQEPYLEPFWTSVIVGADQCVRPSECVRPSDVRHSTIIPAALVTSPEYAMKKLLAAGFDRIYDLGPCFRNNEPWDGSHDPEFLMLEWYRRNASLEDIMRDTEDMIAEVVRRGGPTCPEERSDIGMRPPIQSSIRFPFRRLTACEAMRQYAGVDLDLLLEDRDALASVVRAHGHTVTEDDTWDDLFFKIFLSEVEPKLGWSDGEWQPTFLTHYPACMAALARRDPDDLRYALRVELYIGDLELANGFEELSDPDEQRKRFEEDRALRSKLGKKIWPIDEAFIAALPAMGNAAGIAFGIDRLVMLLTGAKSISDIVPIPVLERFHLTSDS